MDIIAIYKSPGPHFGPNGKTFDCRGVAEDKLEAALAEGWSEDFNEALSLEPVGDGPTRRELEIKAKELQIGFNRRTSNEDLLARIDSALSQRIHSEAEQ